MYESSRQKRHNSLQFGLRSLFAVIAIIAAVLAWLSSECRRFERSYETAMKFGDSFGTIPTTLGTLVGTLMSSGHIPFGEVHDITFMQKLDGDDSHDARPRRVITFALAKNLAEMKELKTLNLRGCDFEPGSLGQLSSCTGIERILLFDCVIPESELCTLLQLPRLVSLKITDGNLSDEGVAADLLPEN